MSLGREIGPGHHRDGCRYRHQPGTSSVMPRSWAASPARCAGLYQRCWVAGPASPGLGGDGPRGGPGGISIGVAALGPNPGGPPTPCGPTGPAGWLELLSETPLVVLVGPGGAALGVTSRVSEKCCGPSE